MRPPAGEEAPGTARGGVSPGSHSPAPRSLTVGAGKVPQPLAPPRGPRPPHLLTAVLSGHLLPPVSRLRYFSSARRSLSRRVPISETKAAIPKSAAPTRVPSWVSRLHQLPPTAGSCSGSDHKMAPPGRKRHSIPPAPFFRPRLRNALIKLNSTGARPQPTGGVTAVRMRLGSSRREAGEK